MFKVDNNKKQKDVNDVLLVFLLLNSTYFTPFSSVSIVEFKQVNVTCVNQWTGFYMKTASVMKGLILDMKIGSDLLDIGNLHK